MQNKGKLLLESKEITVAKAYPNTQKLNQNILTVTAVFLNKKRVNVCEHTTKMASLESFWKVPPGGCERMDGGKFKRKLSEVNTRAVSRRQHDGRKVQDGGR